MVIFIERERDNCHSNSILRNSRLIKLTGKDTHIQR